MSEAGDRTGWALTDCNLEASDADDVDDAAGKAPPEEVPVEFEVDATLMLIPKDPSNREQQAVHHKSRRELKSRRIEFTLEMQVPCERGIYCETNWGYRGEYHRDPRRQQDLVGLYHLQENHHLVVTDLLSAVHFDPFYEQVDIVFA